MDNLIVSYLILNGECMLPGIGKLILQRSDAVCDVASKQEQVPRGDAPREAHEDQ